VAEICESLVASEGMEPHEILILVRSDRNRAFSGPLRGAIEGRGVPVAASTGEGPFDNEPARVLLALLRLAAEPDDHLAWRTVLQLRRNQVGPAALSALYILSKSKGWTFASCLRAVAEDPGLVQTHGQRIAREVRAIDEMMAAWQPGRGQSSGADHRPTDWLRAVAGGAIGTGEDIEAMLVRLEVYEENLGARTPEQLLKGIGEVQDLIEQEIQKGAVNILTMHKAKGLTAKAVVIVGAEDEQLPGRQVGDAQGDERRLLYVSMTRAMHYLFITYCTHRTGQQGFSGRSEGRGRRSLTRFLRDGPLTPVEAPPLLAKLRVLAK
jgi:DNA helicase-2/ATP-dependent DNA helicase PcrA